MLLVEVKDKITIERALKILKKKWDKTGTLKQLRDKKNFKKKSDKRREQVKKAAYIERKFRNID